MHYIRLFNGFFLFLLTAFSRLQWSLGYDGKYGNTKCIAYNFLQTLSVKVGGCLNNCSCCHLMAHLLVKYVVIVSGSVLLLLSVWTEFNMGCFIKAQYGYPRLKLVDVS